jgi:hypothetical protein
MNTDHEHHPICGDEGDTPITPEAIDMATQNSETESEIVLRDICLPLELDEKLAMLAMSRSVSVSVVVRDLVRRELRSVANREESLDPVDAR